MSCLHNTGAIKIFYKQDFQNDSQWQIRHFHNRRMSNKLLLFMAFPNA